jgi:hypothetical protein
MKTTPEQPIREFKYPWKIQFAVTAGQVIFLVALSWYVMVHSPEALSKLALGLTAFSVLLLPVQLWVSRRTFVRLFPDRMEMGKGNSVRTFMRADIRSVGWYTDRGPALLLKDEGSSVVPLLMLKGMDTPLLLRWLKLSGEFSDGQRST